MQQAQGAELSVYTAIDLSCTATDVILGEGIPFAQLFV